MSARLATRELTKLFGSFAAVNDVSVAFARGEIHAVLGENGAGKSTLMKLLFGLHSPSRGEVLFDGKSVRLRSPMDAIRLGLGMVQQHFSLVDTLSVIDNIMLGAEVCSTGGRLARGKAIEHLEKLLPSRSLALPWLRPVSELTVGQKQRLEILKLLFRQSDILVLDEPTAVLAPAEIEELFAILRELKAQGRTIILITHKIKEVLALCDTYTVLRRGEKVGEGRVSEATSSQIVEQMMGRKIEALNAERGTTTYHSLALKIRDLSEVPLRGLTVERGAIKHLTLDVGSGEVVGIAGVENSGQSQLVDAIFGLRDFSGEVEILGQRIEPLQPRKVRDLGVGLVPEDRLAQGLWMEESCTTNLMIGLEDRFLKRQIFQFAELGQRTSGWAREFDVRAPSLDVPVQALSGGNQQKIVFARELIGRAPRLLVCHQPTRGVDLGAIDLIHRRLIAMRDAGLGILMISHELDELLMICDRIVVLFEGRAAAHFERAEFDRFKIGAAMTGAHHGE